VGCLAQRDDASVADDSLERLQVGKPVACFNRLQPNRGRSNPFRNRSFLSRLRREDYGGDHDEKTDESSAHTSQSPGKAGGSDPTSHPRCRTTSSRRSLADPGRALSVRFPKSAPFMKIKPPSSSRTKHKEGSGTAAIAHRRSIQPSPVGQRSSKQWNTGCTRVSELFLSPI
jgi:hypothetical protein